MDNILLNIAEFKKSELNFPYVSKKEIMKWWGIKETTFSNREKLFLQKVDEGFYEKEVCLKMGTRFYNIYAWLHFANNYDYYQDKRLEKRIKPFDEQTIKTFKRLGVS